MIKNIDHTLAYETRAHRAGSPGACAETNPNRPNELTAEQLSHPPHGADEDRRSVQHPAQEQPAPVFLDPLPAEADGVPVKLQRFVPQHRHTCISW